MLTPQGLGGHVDEGEGVRLPAWFLAGQSGAVAAPFLEAGFLGEGQFSLDWILKAVELSSLRLSVDGWCSVEVLSNVRSIHVWWCHRSMRS